MDHQHQEQQQQQQYEQEQDLSLLHSWPDQNISQPEDAFAFAASEPYVDPFQFGTYLLSEEYPTPSSVPPIPDYSHAPANQQVFHDQQQAAHQPPPSFSIPQDLQPQQRMFTYYPQIQTPHSPQPHLAGGDTFVNPQQLDASSNQPRTLFALNDTESLRSNTPSDAGTPPLDASGQRRVNRAFTPEQRQMLEDCFAQHRYPSKQIKETLMANTGLGVLQINNWFTRKRLAEKEEGGREVPPAPVPARPPPMLDTFGIPMYPSPAVMSSFGAATNDSTYRVAVASGSSNTFASSSVASTAQGLSSRPDDRDHAKPVGGLSSVMSQLAAMVDVSGGLKDDTDIEAIKRLFQKETNLGAKSVLLKTLQKTTNQNVLKKIAESKVIVAVRNWLVNATKEDSDLQVLLLEVIKHLPISIEMLKTTNMGKLVRKAGSSDKPDVQRTANEVERHLKSVVQEEAQRRKEEEEREKERVERERKEKLRLEKEREQEKAERAKKELERRAKDKEERERKLKEREAQRAKEVEERKRQREAEAAKKAELTRKSMQDDEVESRKKAKIGGQDTGPTAVTNFDFFNQLAGPQAASRSARPSPMAKVVHARKPSTDSFPLAPPSSPQPASADHTIPEGGDKVGSPPKPMEDESENGFEVVLPPAPKTTTSFTDMYHMAEDVFHDLIPEVRSNSAPDTAGHNLLSATLPNTTSGQSSQDATIGNVTTDADVTVSRTVPSASSALTGTTSQEPASLTGNNRLPGRPFTIRKATEAEVASANAGALGGTVARRPSKGILKRMVEGDGDSGNADIADEGKGTKRQRRVSCGVRFAPENDLVKVRFIEARDVSMVGIHRNAKELDRNEGRFAFRRTLEADQPWSTPRLIQLPSKINPNLRGKHSNENKVQATREESVLMAVYLNKEDIPACPSEADMDVEGEHGEVKIIPIEDVKNVPQAPAQNQGFNLAASSAVAPSAVSSGTTPELSNNISDILKNLTSMGLVIPPPPPPNAQPVKERQPPMPVPVTAPSNSLASPGTIPAPGGAIPNLDSILSMLSNTGTAGNAAQQRQAQPQPMVPVQRQNQSAPFHPPGGVPPMHQANGGVPAFDPNMLTNIMATINGVLKPASQNVLSGPPRHGQPTAPSMMGMPPPMGMTPPMGVPPFPPWEQGHPGGMQPPFNFHPPAEFSHPPREECGRGRGEAFYEGGPRDETPRDSFRGGSGGGGGGRGMRGGGQRGGAGQRGRGGVSKRGGRGGMGDGHANNWDPATRAGAGRQQQYKRQ